LNAGAGFQKQLFKEFKMAHNKPQGNAPVRAQAVAHPEKNEKHPVKYEDLIQAKVQVMDKVGNLMYLEPSRNQGEFILRVVPQ
jgi:hypothetical protein